MILACQYQEAEDLEKRPNSSRDKIICREISQNSWGAQAIVPPSAVFYPQLKPNQVPSQRTALVDGQYTTLRPQVPHVRGLVPIIAVGALSSLCPGDLVTFRGSSSSIVHIFPMRDSTGQDGSGPSLSLSPETKVNIPLLKYGENIRPQASE